MYEASFDLLIHVGDFVDKSLRRSLHEHMIRVWWPWTCWGEWRSL